MPRPVGIDLGTTYSCVACLLNGKVEIIANEFGHRTTPSVVALLNSEEEEVVGDTAMSQLARFPENTIYDAKRLIGRSWEDQTVQDDIKTWPFEVIQTNRGKVKFALKHGGEERELSPEEISAMVLKKMKTTAEAFLGEKVYEAVITVPAYFTDRQKRCTREAGKLAGLDVLRIVPEPSAAALAYGFERRYTEEAPRPRKVLIYDLGGGTFDVTVADIMGCTVKVLAIGGDTHLGGQDMNQRILQHMAQEIKTKTDRDILAEPKKTRRLLNMCELAKRNLTALTKTDLDVMPLTGDDVGVSLTRAKLEDLVKDILNRTIDNVKGVLAEAKLTPEDIEEVILVGGCTRMPCVARLLKEVFPGRDVLRTVNPDEVVAHGAALQAAHLSGDSAHLLSGILVQDVTPISIGIAEENGTFEILIHRHTPIPVRIERDFVTVYNNQDHLALRVFQGERLVAARNQFIGEYTVTKLPLRQALQLTVRTALVVDADGVLSVQAKHLGIKQWESCVLDTLDCSALGAAPAASGDAALYHREDRLELARLQARFLLTRYLAHAKVKVREVIEEAQTWLEKNQDACKEAFIAKLTEVEAGQRHVIQRKRLKRKTDMDARNAS